MEAAVTGTAVAAVAVVAAAAAEVATAVVAEVLPEAEDTREGEEAVVGDVEVPASVDLRPEANAGSFRR